MRMVRNCSAWGGWLPARLQPQANGVAKRFFGKLKEQVIYGRVFGNPEEAGQAVSEFAELYNNRQPEKNGYLSPVDARRANYRDNAA